MRLPYIVLQISRTKNFKVSNELSRLNVQLMKNINYQFDPADVLLHVWSILTWKCMLKLSQIVHSCVLCYTRTYWDRKINTERKFSINLKRDSNKNKHLILIHIHCSKLARRCRYIKFMNAKMYFIFNLLFYSSCTWVFETFVYKIILHITLTKEVQWCICYNCYCAQCAVHVVSRRMDKKHIYTVNTSL